MARIRPSANSSSRASSGLAAAKAAYCSGVIAATSHSFTAQTLADRGLPSKKDCSPSTEPAPTRVRGPHTYAVAQVNHHFKVAAEHEIESAVRVATPD